LIKIEFLCVFDSENCKKLDKFWLFLKFMVLGELDWEVNHALVLKIVSYFVH